MTNKTLPTEEQQKQFAAANLSSPTIPWAHEMMEHSIQARVEADSPFLKTSVTAAKILGIELKQLYTGDESKIDLYISGEDALKKLAVAGGKFPGSDVYAGATKDKWVNAV